MRLLSLALLAAVLVLTAPAAVHARPNPALWATVNICDTPAAPDSMGVRAAMPGDGTRRRRYVRFVAQFYSRQRNRWLTAAGRGRSPWLYVGRDRLRPLQAGWTFPFSAPSPGTTFRVRAVAVFEWRERRRVRRGARGRRGRRVREVAVKRRRRVTRAGVKGAEGGDPPGTSRGSCDIS